MKRALIEDNIVDAGPLNATNALVHWRCGIVKYQNNRTSAGKLVRGSDGDTGAYASEIETEIEDAMLLAL